MAITEAQKRYEKKRSKVCKTYTIKYTPVDMIESDRLQVYLKSVGISANAYLKSLVKKILTKKRYHIQTRNNFLPYNRKKRVHNVL